MSERCPDKDENLLRYAMGAEPLPVGDCECGHDDLDHGEEGCNAVTGPYVHCSCPKFKLATP